MCQIFFSRSLRMWSETRSFFKKRRFSNEECLLFCHSDVPPWRWSIDHEYQILLRDERKHKIDFLTKIIKSFPFRYLELLHSKGISSFMVTNAQFPGMKCLESFPNFFFFFWNEEKNYIKPNRMVILCQISIMTWLS